MKRHSFIWIWVFLFLAGCYTDDFPELNKGAFFKLYGNGTQQEAVGMHLAREGDVYIIGNEFVPNQDSSAVLLIRTNAEGNQLWAKKFYGKGHNTAKAMLLLPGNELLVLASSRASAESKSMPVLYRLNQAGDLMTEYFVEQEEGSSNSLSSMPEDMVLGEEGKLFLLGNLRQANGLSRRAFIKKIDLQENKVLDNREFSNSEVTEAKRILPYGDKCLVLGNTRQEVDEVRNQSIFLAIYTANLIEADHKLIGSADNDFFKKAFLSSRNEFVVLSREESAASAQVSGILSFVRSPGLSLSRQLPLEFGTGEVPEAVVEDENGDFYIAVNAFSERGNTNILIYKMDAAGNIVLEAPAIGGEGNDKIAQLQAKGGYLFLLKTIDMQNENTLISLSRIKF